MESDDQWVMIQRTDQLRLRTLTTPNCGWTQQQPKGQCTRSRDGSSGQKALESSIKCFDKAVSRDFPAA
uniref:Uncharacterized protein n=1 Tax=Hyaloperonospora arabidopsidis (strain Emoy2) TaxID=559515 RepID=M4BLZ7_HYAAE